jgi:hypothetical protein
MTSIMSQDQQPLSIDLRTFFNQYKRAHCITFKHPPEDLLPPYETSDLEIYQLPHDFHHYLTNVSRELIAGANPTGPVFDICSNSKCNATFSSENATYDGCLMIGTHIPDQCFHVIVTDPYHSDYGAVYLNVPNRNTKIKAWKDFTTYITTFVLRVSESLSKKNETSQSTE